MIWKTILLASALLFVSLSKADVTPVTNMGQEQELTLPEAVQIYTGKLRYWPNGEKVTVYLLPQSNRVSREFIFDYLQMSPYQFYEAIEISARIRKTDALIILDTEEDIIKAVVRKSGSIGYVSGFVYYNYRNQVKRVKIK